MTDPTEMDVVFSQKSFKDMVLFSGRFANPSIPDKEWKEVYGFLIGRIIERHNDEILIVSGLIPMIHGSRNEVYFTEQDYGLSEKIMDEVHEAGLFICGWFHTHPGLGLFMSDTDIYNQLGFQSAFRGAIAAVFDFTQISDKNSGLKVYRLNNVNLGNASSYHEIPYQIEEQSQTEKQFVARSLIDISDAYSSQQPLIKEAGEILEEQGSIGNILDDRRPDPSFTDDKQEIVREDLPDLETYSTPEEEKESGFFDEEYDASFKTETTPVLSDDTTQYSDDGYYDLLNKYSEEDWQIKTLLQNIENKKKQNEPTGYLMVKLADRYLQISDFSNALNYLESAEAEFVAIGDKSGEAIVKNELGLFYEDRGDFLTALNYFESARNILEDQDDIQKRVKVLNNIGNIHLKMKEYDAAFNYYKQAFEKSRDIRYHLGMVAALNNTIDVLLFLKNYGLAYAALVNNHRFFSLSNNYFGLGVTYTKFGHLYLTQGPQYYPLAEKYFRMALNVKYEYGYEKESVEDWEHLAKMYMQKGDLASADISITQGLSIVRTFDMTKDEGTFYKLMAELYEEKNELHHAVEYYNLAVENYERFADDQNVAQLHAKLAEINIRKYNNYSDALNHYYGALDLYREQRYSKMIAETLMKIADIHIAMGDIQSARQCLDEAKSIYQSVYDTYSVNLIEQKMKSIE